MNIQCFNKEKGCATLYNDLSSKKEDILQSLISSIKINFENNANKDIFRFCFNITSNSDKP